MEIVILMTPDSTLSGREWINPNGPTVDCGSNTNNDLLLCYVSKLKLRSLYTDLIDRHFMNQI